MIDFINSDRRLGVYETASGEQGVVRYDLVVEREAVPGIAPAVSRREISEVVVVDRRDGARVRNLLVATGATGCIAELLTRHAIAFRFPRSVVGCTCTVDGSHHRYEADQSGTAA